MAVKFAGCQGSMCPCPGTQNLSNHPAQPQFIGETQLSVPVEAHSVRKSVARARSVLSRSCSMPVTCDLPAADCHIMAASAECIVTCLQAVLSWQLPPQSSMSILQVVPETVRQLEMLPAEFPQIGTRSGIFAFRNDPSTVIQGGRQARSSAMSSELPWANGPPQWLAKALHYSGCCCFLAYGCQSLPARATPPVMRSRR